MELASFWTRHRGKAVPDGPDGHPFPMAIATFLKP